MNKSFTIYLLSSVLILLISMTTGHAKTILSIHGSNTIGSQLAPALATAYFNQVIKVNDIKVLRLNSGEVMLRAKDPYTGNIMDIEIFSHGSSTGFRALENNKANIAMSSRIIKQNEIKRLSDTVDMKSVQAEHIIGLDGVAIIVNKNNPVKFLSRETLTAIFSGEITDWSDVTPSAKKQKITVYARDRNSGTFDTFKKLVFLNKQPLLATARRYESNAKLSDNVAADTNAIGFVGLPYIRQSKALAISEGEGDARLPTALTVATEEYALSRRLYMYTDQYQRNAQVQKFIDFVASETGQKIVDKFGFVSQNVYSSNVKVASYFPDEYKTLTNKAKRLSVNIHFKKGTLTPDNRAVKDLERISQYIKAKKKNKKVMLFGFSEDTEFTMFNISLSESRADYVEYLLKSKGVIVERIRGYGAVNPVEANDKIEKNRRVEIWLSE